MAALEYIGMVGTQHQINFLADGDRPVLEIYVDAPDTDLDKDRVIHIKGVGKPLDDMQSTHGITRLMLIAEPTKADEVIPDGLKIVPNLELVALYVIPRIHTLMARVYVPKGVTEG